MKDSSRVEWHFADRLRAAMDENMIDVEDFEVNDICSVSTVRAYLRNEAIPNLRTAKTIADFLQVTVDYLCGD